MTRDSGLFLQRFECLLPDTFDRLSEDERRELAGIVGALGCWSCDDLEEHARGQQEDIRELEQDLKGAEEELATVKDKILTLANELQQEEVRGWTTETARAKGEAGRKLLLLLDEG